MGNRSMGNWLHTLFSILRVQHLLTLALMPLQLVSNLWCLQLHKLRAAQMLARAATHATAKQPCTALNQLEQRRHHSPTAIPTHQNATKSVATLEAQP